MSNRQLPDELTPPWWARESLWRKMAIWVTAGMLLVLLFLTFDSLQVISPGHSRVPDYDVINYRIEYRFDDRKQHSKPVVGGEAPLFGELLSPEAAKAMVTHGKLVTQAKNCMNCHTLLGNGAYYAPDLTKAWLDQGWGHEAARETLMLRFLLDPNTNARTFGTNRRMPNLDMTESEAKAVIAFLKWMSAIDTSGFPHGFKSLPQESEK